MPVKRRVTSSQKMSSVMITTQVMESHSSLTSLKSVTHKRSSSGKMVETWSSPSLALTSPQTWVSGLEAKFLSPPKSPSPKQRITRRSSVYVKPAWSKMSKWKSSPKELEFKIPSSSVTSVSSKRTRQSSVFQKSSGESASSRRSSVYRKNSKKEIGNAVELKQERELDAPKGKKSKIVSPKSKVTKLPVPVEKKSKSPLRVTRTRKRNVIELEIEESPEKPAAKRRKRADDRSISVSPPKGKKSLQKTNIKLEETSAASGASPPSKATRKEPKKASRKTTRKAAQSPSPQRTHSAKSEQLASQGKGAGSVEQLSPRKAAKSPARRKKSAKSPRSPRKAAKSASPQRSIKSEEPGSPSKAAESPASQKKSAKSLRTPRKAAKSPASPRKAAKSTSPQRSIKSEQPASPSKAKSPASQKKSAKSLRTPRKAAKSPASPRKAAKSPASPRKAAKSTSPQRSIKSEQLASPGTAAKSPASQKKSKSLRTPRKAAKSPASPRKGGKSPAVARKAAKSLSQQRTGSAKTAHPVSPSLNRKVVFTDSKRRAKDEEMENTDDDENTVGNRSVTSRAQKRKVTAKDDALLQSPKQKAAKLTSTPQQTTKQKSATLSSSTKLKASLSRSDKVKSRKTATRKTAVNEGAVGTPRSSRKIPQFDSLDLGEETPSKKKKEKIVEKKTPTQVKKDKEKSKDSKQKTTPIKKEKKMIADTPKLKTADTPTSGKKAFYSSAKSGQGKKAAASKSPVAKRNVSTPKSAKKSKGSVKTSSIKKSLSAVRARSAGHKATTERLEISDSLDGSYLQISGQHSKKNSLDTSLQKKRKSGTLVRSAEDEKILEILKKAVGSTPKSKKQISSPKSTKISTPKSAKSSKRLATSKSSASKNQTMTKSATVTKESRLYQKSSDSLITMGTGSRKSIGQTTKAQERRLSSRSLQTPLTHHSGMTSISRIRSDNILSPDLEDLSDVDGQLKRYSRKSGSLLPVAQASRQGQAYQEEKSFAQYVEYRGGSGTERYGTQAVERTVGDQIYRAGSFRTERKKGLQAEVEYEEGRWVDGDGNNSADAEENENEDEDLNATISTSTYSNRCTIL